MLPLFRRKYRLPTQLQLCVCVCVTVCPCSCIGVHFVLLFFFACARSRELNTTLLLTRLPELNSGQNLAKKYMSAGGNSACYRIWYVHDGDDCSALGTEPGRSAVAHEQIKWFPTSGRQQKRLFPYYKQAICKFNAPTVHQHFSSGITPTPTCHTPASYRIITFFM